MEYGWRLCSRNPEAPMAPTQPDKKHAHVVIADAATHAAAIARAIAAEATYTIANC